MDQPRPPAPDQGTIKGTESRATFVVRRCTSGDVTRKPVFFHRAVLVGLYLVAEGIPRGVTSPVKRDTSEGVPRERCICPGFDCLQAVHGAALRPPFRVRGPLHGQDGWLGRYYWCIIMTTSCIFCVLFFVIFIVVIVKYTD